MAITDVYKVAPVTSFECKEWLLKKHYAKRLTIIEYSFGLFKDGVLVGVVTYGTPNSPMRKVFLPFILLELNRLITNEGLERNALSFFVSASLQMLPKPRVIVSYADTAQNHNGYIYQATNFIYTGLSAKRTDWKIKGLEHLHGSTVADYSRGKTDRANYMREKFGDDFYLEERSRKHRYFYFLGNKRQLKQIKNLLPYSVEAYPKGENKRYDSSHTVTVQNKLF